MELKKNTRPVATAAPVAVTVAEGGDIESAPTTECPPGAVAVHTAETSLVVEGATLEEAPEILLGRAGRRTFINGAHEATGDSDAKWVGMLFCTIIIVVVACSEPWDNSRS